MTSSLGSQLAELIPLALVITLSPLTIIPGILMLHTPKPRPTSVAFLAGWTLGIAAATAIFLEVSNALDGMDSQPAWAPYVRLIAGGALIAFGIYRWLTRHKSKHAPKWLTAMTSIGPWRALATALVLVVLNAKVLFMCAAAGLSIGTGGLGSAQEWLALVVFTAISISSVALPVFAYLIIGQRLDEPLNRLKVWMEEQHAALVAVILVLLGLMVLYKGIHAA